MFECIRSGMQKHIWNQFEYKIVLIKKKLKKLWLVENFEMCYGDQCVCQVYMLWNIQEQSGVCHACEREFCINFPGTRLKWPTCPIYHIWPLRSALLSRVSWCARNRRKNAKTKSWGTNIRHSANIRNLCWINILKISYF